MGLLDQRRQSKDQEMINIMQDKNFEGNVLRFKLNKYLFVLMFYQNLNQLIYVVSYLMFC